MNERETTLENPLKGGVPVGRGGFFQWLEKERVYPPAALDYTD